MRVDDRPEPLQVDREAPPVRTRCGSFRRPTFPSTSIIAVPPEAFADHHAPKVFAITMAA
jgi:hypothetical protein